MTIEQKTRIHAELAECHQALRCAVIALGQYETGGDVADFGPALRLAERSTAQLDRLADALDEWSTQAEKSSRAPPRSKVRRP